jgi:hypothetical protein
VKVFRNAIFALVLAAIPFTALVTVSSSEPAPPVAPHRHYFIAGNGEKVYVGPDFCNIDATKNGFAQFHANVHISAIPVDVHGERCE